MTPQPDFTSINVDYTQRVVDEIGRTSANDAVLIEAPPGAGKSSLVVSVTNALVSHDSRLRLPIVTQTNEQADDLVLVGRVPAEEAFERRSVSLSHAVQQTVGLGGVRCVPAHIALYLTTAKAWEELTGFLPKSLVHIRLCQTEISSFHKVKPGAYLK